MRSQPQKALNKGLKGKLMVRLQECAYVSIARDEGSWCGIGERKGYSQ